MPKPRKHATKRNSGQSYVEVFSFSIQVGSIAKLTRSMLKSLPPNHSWRIKSVTVKVNQAFVPGTATVPGFFAPAAVQLGLTDLAAKENVTPVVVCGSGVTRLHIRSTNVDWFTYDAGDFQWGLISAVCLGPAGGTAAYVRGVVSVNVHLSREYISPACVHYTFGGTSEDPDPGDKDSDVVLV